MELILTARQLAVLQVVAKAERALRITEIADRAELPRRAAGDILHDFWRFKWVDRAWGHGSDHASRYYPITRAGFVQWRELADQQGDTETPARPAEWHVDCTDANGEPRQLRVQALPAGIRMVPPPGATAFQLTGAQHVDLRCALTAAWHQSARQATHG